MKLKAVFIGIFTITSMAFADDNLQLNPLQAILQSANLVDGQELKTKLASDIFKFYNLESQYDTPLKKKMFMQSKEYQDKSAEFASQKIEVLKKRYYVKHGTCGEYDLAKKGFWIFLSYNQVDIAYGLSLYFPSLPTMKNEPDPNPLANPNDPLYMLIQMPEKTALEVEKNKASVYIIFNISKYMKRVFTRKWDNYTWDHDVLATYNVRVVVANDSTGEIYYDKSYK